MYYEFLKGFEKRMKNVGRYCLLFQNIGRREIWKKMGLESSFSQVNLVFVVLLYIMEQSLKEENCTVDDIAVFLDDVNSRYFLLPWNYEDCVNLADTIVNVVLGNEGLTMFYEGYDFEKASVVPLHISYVANRIVYPEGEGKGERRTSYYLTEEGYSLLLGTLEVEDNMKLTIQEMIFKLHLEKQSYDKALDDVKNVFNLLRIQIQKIQEAMNLIRHNVLDYSVEQYESITRENLSTIEQTNEKFKGYRETVRSRVRELEDNQIDTNRLGEKEEENLSNLRDIEGYLTRAIDLHMNILKGHFSLEGLYSQELGRVSELRQVQRFSLRKELYDKILEDPRRLGNLDIFLHPLFAKPPAKSFNLAKVAVPQVRKNLEEEEEALEMEDFDLDAAMAEKERKEAMQRLTYKRSLECLLTYARQGHDRLSLLAENLTEQDKKRLIPTVEIFKEVLVELFAMGRADVDAMRKERATLVPPDRPGFKFGESLWGILDENPEWDHCLKEVALVRCFEEPPAIFRGVYDEEGRERILRCQEAVIEIRWEMDSAKNVQGSKAGRQTEVEERKAVFWEEEKDGV